MTELDLLTALEALEIATDLLRGELEKVGA